MKGRGSIRWRMQLSVLTVAGLILAAVIVWTYLASRHRLAVDMEEKAVSLADGAARRIDAQLGLLQGVVNGMALTLESQDYALPFNDVRRMQTRCVEDYDGILGVCVALDPSVTFDSWTNRAGWVYREAETLRYVDLAGDNDAHAVNDWFSLPKYLGRPVWSEPYEWKGILMVTYSVPLFRHQDQFVGVITCDLSLDWLEHMIATLPLGRNGYGLLMSRNGTYISHPIDSLVLNETVFSVAEARDDPQLRDVGQQMVSGTSGILPFVSFATGNLSWLAYTPLESADWIMAALVSREEMQAAIVHLTRRQAAIGTIGLLLLFLAVGMIARSITRPIRELRDAAETLAAGDLDAPLPPPCGRDEVADLTHRFGDMRDNLKRHIADLRETTAVRERMFSELRIAHDIQMGLVPKTFPPFPMRNDLDLFAVIEPAREVGGDFYDFFLLDEKRMVVAIGDVSGKGVPAALFMAVTRSFLRSAFRADADIADVMKHVNGELVEGNDSCMFVTLFCAVFDLNDRSLTYVNAGHNPPLIQHVDGHQEWINAPSGTVAGVVEDGSFKAGRTQLPANSVLVLYTDGVTEAMNPDHTLYSEERMAALLQSVGCKTGCRGLTESLVSDVHHFANGAEQSDDITILMLKPREPLSHDEQGKASTSACCRLRVENTREALVKAIQESDRFLDQHQLSPSLNYAIRLAFEELVTNIINYAYEGDERHSIDVLIDLSEPVVLTLSDDGRPFDPVQDAPAPTLEGEVDERPIGGLGLHMIREMGVELNYSREHDRNVLRVIFPPTSQDSDR
jgi:sigma-B regulation protein RsbU (phosphoserine phosphatase)